MLVGGLSVACSITGVLHYGTFCLRITKTALVQPRPAVDVAAESLPRPLAIGAIGETGGVGILGDGEGAVLAVTRVETRGQAPVKVRGGSEPLPSTS